MMSPQLTVPALTLNFIEALLANGYKWCFSDGFMLKIYLSSSSGTKMFDIHRYYRNVRQIEVDKYEEKTKSDGGRSSVPFRSIC